MSKIQRYGGIKVNWIEDLNINKNIFLFNFFFHTFERMILGHQIGCNEYAYL